MKKFSKRNLVLIEVLLVIVAFSIFYFWNSDEVKKVEEEKTVLILSENDLHEQLPLTKRVEEDDTKLETIAYRLWYDLMANFKDSGQLTHASFTRFQFLEGDDEAFKVAVIFQVQLGEDVQKTNWGKVEEDRFLRGMVWELNIKKAEDRTYTLETIEKLTDPYVGLPPVQDSEDYRNEVGIPEVNEEHRYEIVDGRLKVTYNNGGDWVEVPVNIEELFEGDYNGTTSELIDGSYVIHPERTAFVIGGNETVRVLLSTDQGSTWEEVFVTDELPGVRLRYLGFTSEQDGYLIVTGYRTMSSEGHVVFKTNDGGQSWYKIESVTETMSLVTDAGFINNEIGFLSFGSFNWEGQPPRPWLYRTGDGGNTWEEVAVPIPDEYKGYFTEAEVPVFNEDQGTLLVNQGPNGDYLGGNLLAKFTSEDKGKTWTFAGLVDVDGVLGF
ncbi:WD40/YVTN/BNR-like repeat-containing protein [Mesobacillus maritimus]|uniref:WD40/YVTN/BNR-like repeat-containing protein n=1 Tax=Mesobacillus maritimus TaxID=1643336 RepID=UPI00385077F4